MRIKELRTACKFSQKDLANQLGIAQNTFSQYETSKREPDQQTLLRIADFFNVTTDYLLGRTNEKKPAPIGDELSADGKRIAEKVSRLSDDRKKKVEEYIALLELQERQ